MKVNTWTMTPNPNVKFPHEYENNKGGKELEKQTWTERNYENHNW